MLCFLVFVFVLIFGVLLVVFVLVQDIVVVVFVQQIFEQVVKMIVYDLDIIIVGYKDELKNNCEKFIVVIDDVFLLYFDIDYVFILVFGQYVCEVMLVECECFVKVFYNFIINCYVEGLLNYIKGVVVVLLFNGDFNDKCIVVCIQVVFEDGKKVLVDYVFCKSCNGDWKVYDVIIEGIFYVINYCNQVDVEICKVGIDQLIINLEMCGEDVFKIMEKDGKVL